MNKRSAFYCLLFLVSISKSGYASVSAKQSQQHIPDVLVKHKFTRTSTSGAVQHTLTRQQIAMTGASTLTDALHATAGLQLHDASGTGSQASIGMRGFGANASSNSLVLINGIPLTNPDLMPPDINTLPLEDINRIEIISGSESVLYGDQAVGGLINIITDDINDKNLRLQCGVGSYNLRECHARFANAYRALHYQINLTGKNTANYREHNRYTNDTLLGSVSYLQNGNLIAADYKFTHEDMQYPGALTAAQVRQNRRQASNATDFFKDNNQFLHLKFKRPLSSGWTLTTDAVVRGMSGDGVLFAAFSQSRGGIFLRPQLLFEDAQQKLTAGIDARADRYRLESPFGLTDNQQTQGGVFALLNRKITEKLAFIIGARGAEQRTQLNTSISAYTINRAAAATLGITYELSQQVALYLRRAGSFRFPKADENSGGNQPLRTQRGVSYEGGMTWEKDNNVVDASLYQLNLRDEIAFDPFQTPQNPFGTNTNLAPTARTGAALSAKRQLSRLFTADAQLNYVDARFQSGATSGKQIPLVSDWTARGGMLYRITNNWHAYAEAIYTGRQFPANDNANVTGGQGGYTIYNFNLRYHYKTFSASLHMNNIFNNNYYLYTVLQSGTEFFYPAPDRNVVLTVNYAIE